MAILAKLEQTLLILIKREQLAVHIGNKGLISDMIKGLNTLNNLSLNTSTARLTYINQEVN